MKLIWKSLGDANEPIAETVLPSKGEPALTPLTPNATAAAVLPPVVTVIVIEPLPDHRA